MKTIISASRRTDMPRWYLDRLVASVRSGSAEVPNPYSGKTHTVSLAPENVHTLVLWSKDFSRFLEQIGEFRGYNRYFLFTINDMPVFEPALPPLRTRMDQAVELARRFGPERIGWRFDPVVFTHDGPVMTPDTFRRIAAPLADAGISRAIFSFLDLYGKVEERNRRFGLGITDPSDEVKRAYAAELLSAAHEMDMTLESCCEPLCDGLGIKRSACIDGALLERLAGEPASRAKDGGQREACGCTISRDIGSYAEMPCPHGCLYCYANPVIHENPAAHSPEGGGKTSCETREVP